MFTAGFALKRSRRGEPEVQLPVENAENGTSPPELFLTYHWDRSAAAMR